MDVGAVCAALADQGRQIDKDVTAYDHFPHAISEPAWLIADVQVVFDQAYNRGADQLVVTAALAVTKADDKASSRRLYAYLGGSGARSVKEVIEANPDLGGACNDLTITRARIPRVLTIGGSEYWAAEFTIEIDGEGAF